MIAFLNCNNCDISDVSKKNGENQNERILVAD